MPSLHKLFDRFVKVGDDLLNDSIGLLGAQLVKPSQVVNQLGVAGVGLH